MMVGNSGRGFLQASMVACWVKAGGEMEYVAVETVNDLVSWLLAKHPRMRTAMLNFEGRNKVVYMREEDYRDEGGSLSLVT